MLYLIKRAKYALYILCALGVLIVSGGAAHAAMITLDKDGRPSDELAAVKDALHLYDNDVDFIIDSLIYLAKFETNKNLTNGQYEATEENPDAENSIFTLSNVVLDSKDGELLLTSVGFSPDLMLVLLVVDGDKTPANLYFNGMFSNVSVGGGNKAISHLTVFGYLQDTVDTMPTVPVPAALPLFGTGIALLGLLSWRRKRRSAKTKTR